RDCLAVERDNLRLDWNAHLERLRAAHGDRGTYRTSRTQPRKNTNFLRFILKNPVRSIASRTLSTAPICSRRRRFDHPRGTESKNAWASVRLGSSRPVPPPRLCWGVFDPGVLPSATQSTRPAMAQPWSSCSLQADDIGCYHMNQPTPWPVDAAV